MDGQTARHGETSIPPYFVAGGINKNVKIIKRKYIMTNIDTQETDSVCQKKKNVQIIKRKYIMTNIDRLFGLVSH